jgi:hypothetical protein
MDMDARAARFSRPRKNQDLQVQVNDGNRLKKKAEVLEAARAAEERANASDMPTTYNSPLHKDELVVQPDSPFHPAPSKPITEAEIQEMLDKPLAPQLEGKHKLDPLEGPHEVDPTVGTPIADKAFEEVTYVGKRRADVPVDSPQDFNRTAVNSTTMPTQEASIAQLHYSDQSNQPQKLVSR